MVERVSTLVVGVIILACGFTFSVAHAAIPWDIEAVDSDSYSGYAPSPSVAVDNNGNVHVSYFKRGVLTYARKDKGGTSWTSSVVDSQPFAPYQEPWTSIAVDSSNAPRISYSGKYASWDGSAWNIQSTGAGHMIYQSSLAIDKNDKPHISTDGLTYETYDGSVWVVKNFSNGGTLPSLDVDSNNNPHICYFDFTQHASHDSLEYATFDGTQWIHETIDPNFRTHTSFDDSLTIDSKGVPHVVYYEQDNNRILYATRTPSGWSTEAVGTGAIAVSLAMDKKDNPVIAYVGIGASPDDFGLYYLTNDGTGWKKELVTTEISDSMMWKISMTIDQSGNPLIVYPGGFSDNYLMVASGTPPAKLLLWNKLGSEYEVTHSPVGPALSKILSPGGSDVNYVEGKFGAAVQFSTYGGGGVLSGPTDFINKREGCVEMWIKAPLDVENGVIQDMPQESWSVFYAVKWDGGSDYRGPTINFGQGSGSLAYLILTYPYGSAYTEIRDLVSTYSSGEWVHIATVWDVNKKIDGNKSLAMYVNGEQVAYSLDSIQAAEPWRDIFTLGGDYVNTQNFHDGVIDNIKIWNYAKTDFSDRFVEDGGPNEAPVAQGLNVTTREYVPVGITLTATDANSQRLIYEIAGSPAHGTISVPDANQKIIYTPTSGYYGADSFTFIAFDGELYSEPATVNITVKMNNPPTFSPIGGKTIDEAQALQFTVSATDPDGDALTYSALNLPDGAVFDPDTGAFSWMPTYVQAGIYPIALRVTDSFGAVTSEMIQITVNNVNRSPVARLTVISVDGHTVRVSAAASSDPDTDDTLIYRWDCEPPLLGAFGNPSYSQYGIESTVVYPRNLPSGTYKISLYVTDLSGSQSVATASVYINWSPVAHIVSIIQILPKVDITIFKRKYRILDATYSFIGYGTDDDGVAWLYEWSSNRDGWLGYHPLTIRRLSKGTHIISFRVMDLTGKWSSVATRTITAP